MVEFLVASECKDLRVNHCVFEMRVSVKTLTVPMIHVDFYERRSYQGMEAQYRSRRYYIREDGSGVLGLFSKDGMCLTIPLYL